MAGGAALLASRAVDQAISVRADLFSLNILNLEHGVPWPSIPFKSWRNSHAEWAKLEPERRVWRFDLLDRDIQLATQRGVDVMLILGSVPNWARPSQTKIEPADIEDWRNYVRTVAMRYKGRVHLYELWNEANVGRFYSGAVDRLVELSRAAYQVLKEVDPSITVISPALSPCCNSFPYLDEYFVKGGGQYADVIGYHFYVAPHAPEAMVKMIGDVRAVMAQHGVNKPLWNTETGWNVSNHDRNDWATEKWAGPPLSDSDAPAYLARSYIISAAFGVERFYWYAWGHRSMGMTEYDGKRPKSIATAYAVVQQWIVGATRPRCTTNSEGAWVCTVQRDGSPSSWIVWNPDKNTTFRLPVEWRAGRYVDVLGNNYPIPASGRLEVHGSPLLIQSAWQ